MDEALTVSGNSNREVFKTFFGGHVLLIWNTFYTYWLNSFNRLPGCFDFTCCKAACIFSRCPIPASSLPPGFPFCSLLRQPSNINFCNLKPVAVSLVLTSVHKATLTLLGKFNLQLWSKMHSQVHTSARKKTPKNCGGRIIEKFGLECTFKGDTAQHPCNKQVHLQLDQVAQNTFQCHHECSQGWGINHLSEQPVSVIHHSHSKRLAPSI